MPGVLERFQSLFGKRAPQTDAEGVLAELQDEINARKNASLDTGELTRVISLLDAPPELQRDVLLAAAEELGQKPLLGTQFWWRYHLPRLCNLLLARSLPFDAAQLTRLVQSASHPDALRELSLGHLLKQVSRIPLERPLKEALVAFDDAAKRALRANLYQRLAIDLEPLIGKKPSWSLESGGAFSEAVFEQLSKRDDQLPWRQLFQLGFTCTGARPTKKWAEQMSAAIDKVPTFTEDARAWLKLGPTPGGEKDAYVPETDAPYLRALVFAIGVSKTGELAGEVGTFAAACFKKVRGHGPVSQLAGNACLWTLGEVGLDGVGQLGRLKTRVKYAVALRLIDKALNDAATRAGMSPDDLEEIGVPTCDLDENSRFEDIEVTPLSEVKFTNKANKARAKDIEAMLVAQKLRLERLFLTDRSWPYETFTARFMNHPLLQTLARRLVWRSGDQTFTYGTELKPDELVTLWHPLDLPDPGLSLPSQPFKQIGRETYPFTERVSMRFSGRQISQHRFAALCRERGWTFRLQGEFDSMNDAVLTLPRWGLTASLGIAPAHGGVSGAGIFLQVETGELTFDFEEQQPPARVLSEVMRDVALFIQE